VIKWLHSFARYPQLLRKIISALFLVCGFVLATVLLIMAILIMIFPGSLFALLGNKLGFNTLYRYDCLWNWILGGDIDESISSRLGKSIFAGHPPVFFSLAQDKLVAVFLHQLDHDHVRTSILPEEGLALTDEQYHSIINDDLGDALAALGVRI